MSGPMVFTELTKQAIEGIRSRGFVDPLVLQPISDTQYILAAQKDETPKATVDIETGEITYA